MPRGFYNKLMIPFNTKEKYLTTALLNTQMSNMQIQLSFKTWVWKNKIKRFNQKKLNQIIKIH